MSNKAERAEWQVVEIITGTSYKQTFMLNTIGGSGNPVRVKYYEKRNLFACMTHVSNECEHTRFMRAYLERATDEQTAVE